MTSRRVIALIVGAVTLLGGSLSAATASAAAQAATKPAAAKPASTHPKGNVQLPGPVSQTPLTYTPNVTPGTSCGTLCKTSTIHSTVVVNGEIVVAGVFGNVCTPAPATYAQCPATVPASYMFAYNPATGAIDPNFNPTFNDPVYSLAIGPDNTVYAGGAFTTADGATAKYLTQLYVTPGQSTDGTIVPGFSASTSAAVNAVALSGNSLYVGGDFAVADGVDTTPIVRLNATTGARDKSFKFTLGDVALGAKPLDVKTMSLSPNGDTLVIAGSFRQVNGQSTPRLAVISTGGGIGNTATLDNFSVPLLNNACSSQHDYVNGVDFSPDGSFFVIADTGFKPVNGPGLCDATARFNLSSTGSDVTPAWVDFSGGDSFRSLVVAGSVVYVGGHERWLNNECGSNSVCQDNEVLVGGIGAIDANTGLALPWWHPMTARGIGVQSLATYPAGTFAGSDGGVILGTDVDNIAGVSHDELAMFPMTFTSTPAAGGSILNGMFSQGWLNGLDETSDGVAPMCVDDEDDGSASGSVVDLATCDNSVEQDWVIGSGNTIQVNGLCLDTQGGATAAGTPLVLNACDGAISQVWTQSAGNTVINEASGRCLDDPDSSTTSGTQLDISTCTGAASQSWPLPVAQASPPPPPTGAIFSDQGLPADAVPCMSDEKGIQTQGNAVVIQVCEGLAWQNWTLESDGTIQFKGRCLDTSAGGTASGTDVVLDKCTGATSQVWQMDSSRHLINQASQLCLNDPGDTAGTQLDISTCNNSANDEWRLPAV